MVVLFGTLEGLSAAPQKKLHELDDETTTMKRNRNSWEELSMTGYVSEKLSQLFSPCIVYYRNFPALGATGEIK